MSKTSLKPREKFDSLMQRYGENVICRGFNYGRSLAPSEFTRVIPQEEIDAFTRATGTSYDPDRTREFIFSTSGIKRDGNEIIQDGWVLDKFRKNPIALWCHEDRQPPLGNSPTQWLGMADGAKALRGLIQFAGTARGQEVFELYRDGFLNAVSISWKPLRYEFIDDEELEDSRYGMSYYGGVRFLRSEALEISPVPVPADPDALIKRIQGGKSAFTANDLSIRLNEEVEVEGTKNGVFYVDGHSFEPETKTLVDMGKEILEREETEDKNLFTVNEKVRAAIDSVDDGFAIAAIVFNPDVLDREYVDNWTVTYFQDKIYFDENTFRGNINTTTKFVPNSECVSVPLEKGISIELRKIIPDQREFINVEADAKRGAVPFSIHGDSQVSEREAKWNSSDARNSLMKWATKDEAVDYRTFKKGFAWYDELAPDRTSSYKLAHHDIVDGVFVTSWRGLQQSAQRVLRKDIDIPEGDFPGVQKHLEAEYAQFEEKAPWERSLGKFYASVYESLKEATDENEIAALRESAVGLAKNIFGENRILESWEKRVFPNGDAKAWADVVNVIVEGYVDFVSDSEELERLIDGTMTRVANTLIQPFVRASRLESFVASIRNIFNLGPIDIDSQEDLDGVVEHLTNLKGNEADERLVEITNRLNKRISNETNDVPNDLGNVMQAIVRKLEEESSCGASNGGQ